MFQYSADLNCYPNDRFSRLSLPKTKGCQPKSDFLDMKVVYKYIVINNLSSQNYVSSFFFLGKQIQTSSGGGFRCVQM